MLAAERPLHASPTVIPPKMRCVEVFWASGQVSDFSGLVSDFVSDFSWLGISSDFVGSDLVSDLCPILCPI